MTVSASGQAPGGRIPQGVHTREWDRHGILPSTYPYARGQVPRVQEIESRCTGTARRTPAKCSGLLSCCAASSLRPLLCPPATQPDWVSSTFSSLQRLSLSPPLLRGSSCLSLAPGSAESLPESPASPRSAALVPGRLGLPQPLRQHHRCVSSSPGDGLFPQLNCQVGALGGTH